MQKNSVWINVWWTQFEFHMSLHVTIFGLWLLTTSNVYFECDKIKSLKSNLYTLLLFLSSLVAAHISHTHAHRFLFHQLYFVHPFLTQFSRILTFFQISLSLLYSCMYNKIKHQRASFDLYPFFLIKKLNTFQQ